MREVKIDGKTIPILGNGASILIAEDELHEDVVQMIAATVDCMQSGKFNSSLITKLTYVFAKSANSNFASDYKTFVSGIKHVGDVVNKQNAYILMDEAMDMLRTSDDEEKPAKAKKKAVSKEV